MPNIVEKPGSSLEYNGQPRSQVALHLWTLSTAGQNRLSGWRGTPQADVAAPLDGLRDRLKPLEEPIAAQSHQC